MGNGTRPATLHISGRNRSRDNFRTPVHKPKLVQILHDPNNLSGTPTMTETDSIAVPATKTVEQLVQAAQWLSDGKLTQAEKLLGRILAADSENPDALNLMGVIAIEKRAFDQALTLISRALAVRPDEPTFHYNLGVAHHKRQAPAQAIPCYQRCVTLAPQYLDAWENLALCHYQLSNHDAAYQTYQRVFKLGRHTAQSHANFGEILRCRGLLTDAERHCRHALTLEPGHPAALKNLGTTLYNLGDAAAAADTFRQLIARNPEDHRVHSEYLHLLHYCDGITPAELFHEHRRWAMQHSRRFTSLTHDNRAEKPSRLRIGYLSPDLRRHPVACFLLPLLRHHDRHRFEIHCYADVKCPDEITDEIRRHTDLWHAIQNCSDDQVAERIVADRIDILIDLAGHSLNNRAAVLARKPAPVQVSYLGYPDTTGLPQVDYRFTDELADPALHADRLATERLIRLPGGFLCYTALDDLPPRQPRNTDGSDITFGSFNTLAKVSPATIDLWVQLLQRLPHTRLLLKAHAFTDPSRRTTFTDMLSKHGIDATRLKLLPPEPSPIEHLRHYYEVDIALDTYPYHGTTTTVEALWMGVPVITLAGPSHHSRVGCSILNHVGLSDLIAETPAQYIDTAIALASDVERLAGLQRQLRQRLQSSVLMDGTRLAKSVEQALEMMWSTYCASAKRNRPEPAITPEVFELPDGCRLCTPPEPSVLTNYVLREQGDWFEEELPFVRHAVASDWVSIDIGANFGVYTTACARAAPNGTVFAFEPAADTASYLRETLARNAFTHCHVIEAAVSSQCGTATLQQRALCETNQLVTDTTHGQQITTITLDDFTTQERLERVDFVKIDAEGHEFEILSGARRFLQQYSPLIMLEMRHGGITDPRPRSWLINLGFHEYRLIPLFGRLASADDLASPAQLNAFFCKPDRARELAVRGLLIDGQQEPAADFLPAVTTPFTALDHLPYAVTIRRSWHSSENTACTPSAGHYYCALAAYQRARNKRLPVTQRYLALRTAYAQACSAADRSLSLPRLMTLIRVSIDYGARDTAQWACERLLEGFSKTEPLAFDEPFLAPTSQFEALSPDNRPGDWAFAALLHARERCRHFTTFFATAEDLEYLKLFQSLGFEVPEMSRRMTLLDDRLHGCRAHRFGR